MTDAESDTEADVVNSTEQAATDDEEVDVKVDGTSEAAAKKLKYVKVKVVGLNVQDVYFKIAKTAVLGKMKISYSKRVGFPIRTLRFLFDGKRVGNKDTPNKLKMEDDDAIEVFQEQRGGDNVGRFRHHATVPRLY